MGKTLSVPVCGDPATHVQVCSKRCRDEYLGGYVETREGRTIRLLQPPWGPGTLLAIAWLVLATIRLLGPLLSRGVHLPLLAGPSGTATVAGGAAALLVGFSLLREARAARWFSLAFGVLGTVTAAVLWWRTGSPGWALEALVACPAIVLLSIGRPGVRRVLAGLAWFALYPAAIAASPLLTGWEASDPDGTFERDVFPQSSVEDSRVGLRFAVPAGWRILRPESTLLGHGGALFRAVDPARSLGAWVRDVPGCRPTDPGLWDRIEAGLAADAASVVPVGDPRPAKVASDLGEGRSLLYRREPAGAPVESWYVVLLPWGDDACLEVRCGGKEESGSPVLTRCAAVGARTLSSSATER